MKKFYQLFVVVVLLGVFSSTAQSQTGSKIPKTPTNATTKKTLLPLTQAIFPTVDNPVMPNGFLKDRCGFVTQMNRAVQAGYDKEAFEKEIAKKIEAIKAARLSGAVSATTNYIIPVVFHVIFDAGTPEGTGANVAASQVYEQIDQLNKDFGNQSGSPFGVAANTGISFCPVLKDPLGNTLLQPGIERIDRIAKGWTDPTTFGSSNAQVNAMINYIDATIKPASIWDPSSYVNIWVYNFSNSGLLGYATFPTAGISDLPAGETPTTAGVVFLTGAIGSVASPGTAGNYGLGRTVTHELGHFFGLYHVWGDVTTCGGTDYCADTPPCSDQYFSTVPGCTVPVQCSGLPRMIQNYMDYSDDGCMNTYTQNQTDRIQAVMLGAPNRPRNPAATLCTPPVANAINFTSGGVTTAETGVGATCPKFKDYTVSIAPAVAASGNATVSCVLTGTATQNVDYTVIGSTTFNYVNGQSTVNSFTIRINDDAEVEPTETIIVSLNITGTGLVLASTNQTHTINITDDDTKQFINNTATTTTLLSEDFGTAANSGALPTGWFKGSFLGSGSNVWTVNAVYGAATGFTAGTNGRVLHITGSNAAAQTAETATNVYTAASESDVVAVTKPITTTGFSNIKLEFDYACNGEADANGIYDFGALLYSTTAQTSGFSYITNAGGSIIVYQGVTGKTHAVVTLPAAAANQANLWIGFEWYNDGSIRGVPGFTIDNVVVTGATIGVETVLNQTITNTQNANQTAQYISGSNNIIADITNLNSNIGCITSTVTQAGTALQTITTDAGSYQRSNKVIQITPATPNSTATYQATFYYTTAELAAWSANVPNLKLMKVTDGVNLSSTLNTSNSIVITPTVDDQRATKGYVSYTGSFTGFSQFILVSPLTVLPVSLVNFDAKAASKNIVLTWNTTFEVNNKGFVIERSTDRITYERIGWVNGAVNSNKPLGYSFTDNFVQPNTVYYYRLKQTDLDDRSAISDVKQARVKGAGITIVVSPNPTKDVLKVFAYGSTGTSDILLFNTQGQQVKNWDKVNLSSTQSLNIAGLAKGMYLLKIKMGDETKVEKLIVN